MKRNKVRVGLLSVALSAGVTTAGLGSAQAVSIVPPASSDTAYGFAALIAEDGGERTVKLVSPKGAYSTLGQVSEGARVMDISTNARTVVTGFTTGAGELRVTLWDAQSKQPTYLRVSDGQSARLVRGGVLVERAGKAPRIYSRSGDLMSTLPSAVRSAVPSHDGTKLFTATSSGVQIRAMSGGQVHSSATFPDGFKRCAPTGALGDGAAVNCDDGPITGATSYRFGESGDLRVITKEGGNAFKVDGGHVVDSSVGDTALCSDFEFVGAGKTRSVPGGDADICPEMAGAHGDSVYLVAGADPEWSPDGGDLLRYSVATGKTTRVAGLGTLFDGVVTSAKVVDGT